MMVPALLLALTSSASADPASWTHERLATELRPVRPDALAGRWHDTMGAQMAGPRASSVFRSTASRMDVALRLAEFDGAMPYVSRDQTLRAIDLAVLGAGLGWQTTLGDLVQESDALGGAREAVRSALSPGVAIQGGEKGAVVKADDGPRNASLVDQEIEDPSAWRQPTAAPTARRPSLRAGVTGAVATNLDPALEGGGYEDDRPYRLTGRTFVQVDNVVLDAIRMQVSGSPQPSDGDLHLSMGWSALGRQALTRHSALIGEIGGSASNVVQQDPDLRPLLLRSALDVRVAPRRGWVVRTSLARVRDPDGPTEVVAGLSFRVNTGWVLPVSADGYPRGTVPGVRSRGPLHVPDSGPLQTAPLVQAPVERMAQALGSEPPEAPAAALARGSSGPLAAP